MLVRVATCALLAATPCMLLAQTPELLATVNQLRAPGGACNTAGTAAAAPMVAQAALNIAAGRMARGQSMEAALRQAGYRATRAQLIRMESIAPRMQLAPLLAQRFCSQVGAIDLSELGLHAEGNRWWIVLAAPFAPRVALTTAQMAERMLALVNQARAQPRSCGDKAFAAAPPLAWNAQLTKAAERHADDMAARDYFSHDGRDGSKPHERVQASGYRYRATGENIAAGQLTLEAAMAGWIQSPGHCVNIMNSSFTELGAAFATSASSRMGVYWVQEFGRPMGR